MSDKLEPDSSWKRFHSKNSGETIISQYCPERAYVELQVPLATRAVQRIVFTTISHDQGFSNEERHYGTYDASHTWFQVAIMTPSGRNRAPPRRIQYNMHGNFEYRTHTNTWDFRDSDPSISTFLKEIHAGDIIQVIPKAQYLAWRNYVKEAEIELFVEEAEDVPESGAAIGTEEAQIYYPLSSLKEIRLIRLYSGSNEDELSCSIEHNMSLEGDAITPYEALSYCWGDPKDTARIKIIPSPESRYTCNSFITITSSLGNALKNIRYNDGRYRMLWIDAVCINQNDLEERVQQLEIMTDIYSHATQTLIWLGKSNPAVEKDIKDARMILERYNELLIGQKPIPTMHNLHSPLFDGGYYYVRCSIFDYDYFTRVWVLQEAFNAKKISVYCGHDILPWSMVLRLNDCINRSMLIANPLRKSVMVPLFASLFEFKKFQDEYATKESRMGILEVLVRGLDLNATDPRDKIFALLGFGHETFNISQLPPEVRPDYSKSVAQVFREFTRWWILTHGSLCILSAVQLSMGRTWQQVSSAQSSIISEGRPTWSFWHDGMSLRAQSTLGLLSNSAYRACGTTVPDVTLISQEQNSCILPLRGRRVGTIKSKAIYPFFADHSGHESLHKAYEAIFDPINTRGTWLSGILQDEVSETRGPENQEERKNKLIDHIYAHMDFTQHTAGFECHIRSLFRTSEGTSGLCPAPAQEGDIVVVLCGGLVPYILRPRENDPSNHLNHAVSYELVGECYLEGFMHGEAMQQENGENVALEVFELV